MRLSALLVAHLVLLTSALSASAAAPAPDPRLQGAYKFNEGGWTYVHLQGTPEQVGFQHGYLLAREIEDNVHVYQVDSAARTTSASGVSFATRRRMCLWPHIEPSTRQELKGIAEGLQAQGSTLDLWDVVALNGDIELSNYYCRG